MKSQNRLKYTPDAEFSLIGITCSESIIRLSWILNQSLRIKLHAGESLRIHNEKLENPQEFQLVQHTNLQGSIVYRLIENKCDLGFLSLQYRHFDFFLQYMKENDHDIDSLLTKIKRENDIGFAALIEKPGKDLIQKIVI